MNSNYQEWHNTTSNDTVERISLRIARWRMLELLWKESWWTLREEIESLINHHVKPPWRTPVRKEWTTKMKDKRIRLKPCNDLDGSSWWYNWNNFELRKERWTTWTENLMNLRNSELITWKNNSKDYAMRILHQFKLMTNNGFGILLILKERIKIDIATTWECLQRNIGGIETTN